MGLQSQHAFQRLLTGIRSLDGALGGLESRRFHLIVGEEKSGRTTFALQVASIASRQGVEALWLDCGGRLHYERLNMLARRWQANLNLVRIAVPETFAEQVRLLIWACDYVREPGLIVIDDFTYLNRVEAVGDPARDKRFYKGLAFQSALLKDVTRTRNVTSMAIVDIHERPGVGGPEPAANAIVSYYSDTQIWMRTIGTNRKLLKLRLDGLAKEFPVSVYEGGLTDA